MALANVTLQYQYFADPTRGRPIALGSVFVGIVDTDPETPSNQLEIFAKQEDGTEVPINQPVSLSAGGVPQLNGSPIRILVEGAHALKVLDSGGDQVYYLNDSIEGTAITAFGEALISAEDADAGRVVMNSMKKVSTAVTDNLMTFDSDDEAKDSLIPITRVVQIADAAGGADALTAAFSPAIAALTDGLQVRVKATAANTTTTPTVDYDGLGAKTIVKNGNQPLAIGDIANADHELQLVSNTSNDNVELLNPAAVEAADLSQQLASAWFKMDGAGATTLQGSFNISSVTRNVAGNYTPVFDTDFLTTDYSCVASAKTSDSSANSATERIIPMLFSFTTTGNTILTTQSSAAVLMDCDIVSAHYFGGS